MLTDNFTILALETSCDETAAAIVRGGRTVVANVVASQIDEHRRYGGVVPEVAARQHILALPAVVGAALAALPGGWASVNAVAVTYGPGLSGALLTGLSAAKALAWARGLPFVGVNHIEAHIYANWLDTRAQGTGDRGQEIGDGGQGTADRGQDAESLRPTPDLRPLSPVFPIVALVVSGGHTLLALLEGHGRYRMLGQTRDDAAGEAFDKVARIMGLGFPGGPAVQRAAEGIAPALKLPRAWLRDSYDFSFSGLKTAVLHQVQAHQGSGVAGQGSEPGPRPLTRAPWIVELAAAFQESVVDVLVTKALAAAHEFGATEILLAGGVAANTRLRAELRRRAPVPVRYPPIALCTDNAAMVAAAAFYRFAAGVQSDWALDVRPNLALG